MNGILRALIVLGLGASLLQASPARAAGTSGGGVVLTPSDSQGNEIKTPGYFELTADPGSSQQVDALVGNIQRSSVDIVMAPVDAKSGVYGGISYDLPQQRRKLVGAWMSPSRKSFRLASHKASVVTVTIHVPASTKPGQYVGGLTAYVPARRSTGELVVQLRRVVAVVITVPGGPLFGRFTLETVRPKKRPDAVYVIAHIRNTGTILLKGQGHLWIWMVGRKRPLSSTPLSLDTTVPDTTVYYPVRLSKRPKPSEYAYKLTVSWGTSGKATRTGTFVLSK